MKEDIMKDVPNKELLKEASVLEEVSRHRWIESEKAGYDVGQEWAENDWLISYSKDWKVYHSAPKKKEVVKEVAKGAIKEVKKEAPVKPVAAKEVVKKTVKKAKKRSAKSY